MARRGSLAEQLEELQRQASKPAPKAANDNKPQRPAYKSDLPALRWLHANRPDLAKALADALPRAADNWFVEVEPTRQEIRPTVGELMAASCDDYGHIPTSTRTVGGHCYATIGALKFRDGQLIEWGATKKGRKLKPVDRPRASGERASKPRDPSSYLSLRGAVKTPMDAGHYHRPFSGEPALPSMYDPLPGVEEARATLRRFGVDGSASCPSATKCKPGIAEGALFLGGVSNPSGNSSSGAVMFEGLDEKPSNAQVVIEEVAARGTLKSIGLRLGYSEDYADRAGRAALVEVAEILTSIKKAKTSVGNVPSDGC